MLNLFLILGACNRTTEEKNVTILKIHPPFSINTNENVSDSNGTLSLVLENQILRSLKNFQGHKFHLSPKIPDSWAIEYEVESFSDDFNILIISNIGDPVLKIIATTSPGNDQLISAIPVAYTAGKEGPGYVISEYWQANISEDYGIEVVKDFSELYSLSNDGTATQNNKETTKTDRYTIEDNGNIAYIEEPSFDFDYMAFVVFADTAKLVNSLDETWIFDNIGLHEKLEPLNILFKETYCDFNAVSIYNYLGEEVDIVDIRTFTDRNNIGYIALQKGKEPLFIPYCTPLEGLRKAMNFYQMEIPLEWFKTEEEIVVPDETTSF